MHAESSDYQGLSMLQLPVAHAHGNVCKLLNGQEGIATSTSSPSASSSTDNEEPNSPCLAFVLLQATSDGPRTSPKFPYPVMEPSLHHYGGP